MAVMKRKDSGASVARRVIEAIERELPIDRAAAIKLPSRTEIANRYNVSLSTVTAALKQLQHRRMVHWIPGKGIYSGPGRAGESSVRTAALVGWFSHLSSGAETSVDSYRWYLLHDLILQGVASNFQITVIPNDEQGPINFGHLQAAAIDALLVKDAANAEHDIPELRKLGVPLLSDGAKYSRYGVPSVSYDNVAMVRKIVDVFVSRGHRRIAYIGMETSHPEQNQAMRQTFITSLVDAGLIYDYNAYWHNTPWGQWRTNPTFGFIEDTGYAVGQKILSLPERPTAFFAWQPSIARGVNRAAVERGLSVPGDVSIMTDAVAAGVTPFSTFLQPHRELAQGLLDRLAQLTDDPTSYFEDKLQKQFVDQGSIATLG